MHEQTGEEGYAILSEIRVFAQCWELMHDKSGLRARREVCAMPESPAFDNAIKIHSDENFPKDQGGETKLMKLLNTMFAVLLGSSMMWAQAGTSSAGAGPNNNKTADQIKALQAAVAEQQKQIESLRRELAEKNSAPAAPRVVNASLTSTSAAPAQDSVQIEQQKKVSELEGIAGRFRLSGDIRVRQEDFFQSYSGCVAPNCNSRSRERIRLRLGIRGKLNEDFSGGVYLATGALTDPTSTNETLTNVFERKSIGFDRGYITYNPLRHKWISITGGKFAYTWNRTEQTFDSDLNPEGFTEKLSFNIKNSFLKNVSLQGMQLFFNEVSKGSDSYATGGQFTATLAVSKRWSVTPSYTVLSWHNIDAILNASPSVTGKGTVGPFAPNGMTNATFTDANGVNHFVSGFLYSDLIVNNKIRTPMEKLPLNLNLELINNLNAATNQSHAYYAEAGFGQQKARGDWKFGYAFVRQEQDSVISSFNQSDQRAPTNVVDHRFYLQYKVAHNAQLAYTQWFGRTLNVNLVNAATVAGNPAGAKDPTLSRMQFDVIYSF